MKIEVYDVVAIGMATVDTLVATQTHPAPNSENRITSELTAVGGPIGRGAITATRAGVRTLMIATIGTGSHADLLRSMVDAERVETVWLTDDSASTSQHSFVWLPQNTGDRVTFWAPQPKFKEHYNEILERYIKNAKCLLIDSSDQILSSKLVSIASKYGTDIVIDTGSFKESVEEYINGVSHVVAPRKFFEERAGGVGSAEDEMKNLFSSGRHKAIVMTDGSSGGKYIDSPGKIEKYEPHLIEMVVDSCGAGDTFHGAYASAISLGRSVEEACGYAAYMSGEKCREFGNPSIPYKDYVSWHAIANKVSSGL